MPATYNIRLYPQNTLEADEDINTISFISYYPFSTYIYKIYGDEKDGNTNPIETKIENFPEDKPYLVSIIGITNEEEKEEFYSYDTINDPYNPYDDDENGNSFPAFLIIAIIIFVILLFIFSVVIYRMIKQKKLLESEILKVSSISSRESSFAQNKDPNEPFIKEDGL